LILNVFKHKSHTAYELRENLVFIKVNDNKVRFFHKWKPIGNFRFSIGKYCHIRLPFFYFSKNNGGWKIGGNNLLEYLINTYTKKGETVLDNCMGSGTTAIACINTNRNYIGFEVEKQYYDLANERIKKYLEESMGQMTGFDLNSFLGNLSSSKDKKVNEINSDPVKIEDNNGDSISTADLVNGKINTKDLKNDAFDAINGSEFLNKLKNNKADRESKE